MTISKITKTESELTYLKNQLIDKTPEQSRIVVAKHLNKFIGRPVQDLSDYFHLTYNKIYLISQLSIRSGKKYHQDLADNQVLSVEVTVDNPSRFAQKPALLVNVIVNRSDNYEYLTTDFNFDRKNDIK